MPEPIVEEQPKMEEEEELEAIPGLNDVPGTDAPMATAAMFISLALAACALVGVWISAWQDEEMSRQHWIDRTDAFHPQVVAISDRFFSQLAYAGSDPSHPSLPFQSPFIDNTCLCKDPKLAESYPEYCKNHATSCQFKVPFTALFAAMTGGFFGFAACGYYARSVMAARRGTKEMDELGDRIANASMLFLSAEYNWLMPFVFTLFIFIFFAVDGELNGYKPDASVPFLIGAFFSAGCGYMGMSIATQGNVRTAAACAEGKGYTGMRAGLQIAFRAGACMGIGVVSFGLLGLSLSYMVFANVEALGGFGFGASAVALFARVGGGIYTKAADVGGDLCGKVEAALDEDNPKNPATIADCVGDNVGDTAGMGADLFESFVGSIIAAMVLGATEFGERGVALPLYISVIGLVVSVVCTVYVHLPQGKEGEEPGLEELLAAMSYNIYIAAFLIIVGTVILCMLLFKREADYLDEIGATHGQAEPGARVFGCIVAGLFCGILIGKVTEYFTSHTEEPTQSIAQAGQYGPGPVVIQGLGMGMFSTVVPMLLIVITVLVSYGLAGFYGIAISCVGMLSTLGVTMSTDAYGPVSDNAGGIAEMCELPSWVRESTDKLDALGNTTAATGKGFSNGSAVLAALSLLAAFARSANISNIDIVKPEVVCGLLLGALQPYIFSAMTMLSVNKAAQEMMAEVRRQFMELKDDQGRHLLDPDYDGPPPDYDQCIRISTDSSLREMLLPGALAIFCPLTIGFLLGSHALTGFLLGAIASGYLLGVQMSNTGGAWDNAKKWVESDGLKLKGIVRKKKSPEHSAVVVGDTIGDPYKDTSGPSLNILIKLMTQFSFVIGHLLAPGWEYWYIGVMCGIVGMIFIIVINTVVLAKPEHPEDYYDVDDEGVMEKLDFIAAQIRRMGSESDKLVMQIDQVRQTRYEISQSHPEIFQEFAKDHPEPQVDRSEDTDEIMKLASKLTKHH